MSARFPGLPTHHIKVRKKGKKQWGFLSRNTSGDAVVNHLRVHALQFSEDAAKSLVAENAASNPDYEWKIVPIEKK